MGQPAFDPFVLREEEVFRADDYLFFYEDTLAAEQTEAQVARLVDWLSLPPFARVLDVGCGHGRHSVALASSGMRVFGVDRSASFVVAAGQLAESRGVDVVFARSDVRDLSDVGPFDAAVLLFDVLGFFDDEASLGMVRKAWELLDDGGRICVDVRNRDWMVRNIPATAVTERDGNYMLDRHTFDTKTGRLVDHRVIVRDGVVRDAPFSIRLFTYSEVTAMLEQAGFRVDAAYGDYAGGPVSLTSNRMIVVASKHATSSSA